jgi:glutamate-5-semialdehyde dehydrogenase
MTSLKEQCQLAKRASRSLRTLSAEKRNAVLKAFADNIRKHQAEILQANQADLKEAVSLSEAFQDRLMLNSERLQAIADGIEQIAGLEDPLHNVLEDRILSSGIHLQKITVPMGVIGIIFESRPNVSADCTALCFKAGSACILKGGKDSYHSCQAIVAQMKTALAIYGIDENAAVLAENPTHEETQAMMEDRSSVDLLIPRGNKKLIQSVVEHAKVPVIETGAGVCHTYIDASADLDMALKIAVNAKCSRPSVCNAMETLLIHEKVAPAFLPLLAKEMQKRNVIIHADEKSQQIIPGLKTADEESWSTEYNRLEMNLKIVGSVQEAIDHIEKYGTHHSECIVSASPENVKIFMDGCDSACVYHNASTRFTDGFEFGLGGEIGISTQKLHARGPLGLKELTTYTYHLEGKGETR